MKANGTKLRLLSLPPELLLIIITQLSFDSLVSLYQTARYFRSFFQSAGKHLHSSVLYTSGSTILGYKNGRDQTRFEDYFRRSLWNIVSDLGYNEPHIPWPESVLGLPRRENNPPPKPTDENVLRFLAEREDAWKTLKVHRILKNISLSDTEDAQLGLFGTSFLELSESESPIDHGVTAGDLCLNPDGTRLPCHDDFLFSPAVRGNIPCRLRYDYQYGSFFAVDSKNLRSYTQEAQNKPCPVEIKFLITTKTDQDIVTVADAWRALRRNLGIALRWEERLRIKHCTIHVNPSGWLDIHLEMIPAYTLHDLAEYRPGRWDEGSDSEDSDSEDRYDSNVDAGKRSVPEEFVKAPYESEDWYTEYEPDKKDTWTLDAYKDLRVPGFSEMYRWAEWGSQRMDTIAIIR